MKYTHSRLCGTKTMYKCIVCVFSTFIQSFSFHSKHILRLSLWFFLFLFFFFLFYFHVMFTSLVYQYYIIVINIESVYSYIYYNRTIVQWNGCCAARQTEQIHTTTTKKCNEFAEHTKNRVYRVGRLYTNYREHQQ